MDNAVGGQPGLGIGARFRKEQRKRAADPAALERFNDELDALATG